ncbi:helicase-related protein [Paenarthrobacter nicotinovorans]|uniref:helicase-related protein n=1 Tax=Paenarthrobacter nicotinovorans TaxID=29320 RepID=UPI00248576AC|nr:helicase-related protein [Paenarthrobacter nicotinovorans]MDI2019997.1 RNA polymerase-associated protein RapA [Paenarthrobacter nicotinovorans]
MTFESGQRVNIPGKLLPEWVTIDFIQATSTGYSMYVKSDEGRFERVDLTTAEAKQIRVLQEDGRADSARVLAGMWTRWMSAAASTASATLLASTPLDPFAHQANAVYGAMLPQPRLRFLLADEPGTGKTIMAGMYLREAQKLGLIRRVLIVAPANLVTKWKFDFERFFGGELRRITAETVQQHALDVEHDTWVVSLELAGMNANVQNAIRPDHAGWDLVIFDEAHRLTPTAQTFYAVGRLLAKATPRAIFMTATPHRGSEWLFRHLLHLVDPGIYPDPGDDAKAEFVPLKPGGIHFLRRMKEHLVGRDGTTPLFKGRHATNVAIPLLGIEDAIYRRALELVDEYFPATAQPLARMVYGKRAASTLSALAETLERRSSGMGEQSQVEAEMSADPFGDDDAAREEATVVAVESRSARAERTAIKGLLAQIRTVLAGDYEPSKWDHLVAECFKKNGILPGNRQQAVVFTEYADSAAWITERLAQDGYTAQMYSGRQPNQVRDEVRAAFMRGEFQVIVSTDAGNEGIDLQSAHVLVNYDIPWSLVRLEQRMGRIHRVGQNRDVELYNLIATGTREGNTLQKLLDNFVNAANDLDGQMFDSLSAVAEISGLHYDEWLAALYGHDEARKQEALKAVDKVRSSDLQRAARQAREQESHLAAKVDVVAAMTLLQQDLLDRINPAIVEAYLTRLAEARLLTAKKHAGGTGILVLSRPEGLPATLGDAPVIVATSGDALREASKHVDTTRMTALGPGEPAFNDIIAMADAALSADRFQGGSAEDPTSVSNYDLYAFEASLDESDGRASTPWTVLIRVDESGYARPVRWEILANLVATTQSAGALHPAHTHSATVAAQQFALESQTRQQAARSDWFASAKIELQSLPTNLTKAIKDRGERLSVRAALSAQVTSRLQELEVMSRVTVTEPRLMAHIRVLAEGIPPTPEEKDSEKISMVHVRDHLKERGWRVDDISTEGRGYDLLATRGNQQRCIEVKGIWNSAASQGIRMTGNEVLIATQHRTEYWLYVVDHCHDGKGQLFGVYPDPITTFHADIKAEAVFNVPGSSLNAARDQENYE